MENKGCILMSPQELERVALLEKVQCKKITQAKAAQILNLSKRQVIRLYAAYGSVKTEPSTTTCSM